MRKTLINQNLKMVLAMALVASLATFGCTTNTMRGSGEPWTGGPGVGPASPSSTSGTSVPVTPPPMTSSYSRADEPVKPMRSHALPLSAAEAAAIMASHQPRVRVLGPVNPGPANRPYVSDGLVTGQVVTQPVSPQYSINSSINSPGGGMAITSGVGSNPTVDAGAAVFTQSLTTVTPTVLGAAVPPTTAATTGGTTTITGTPTTVAASTNPATVISTGSGSVIANTAPVTTNGNVRVVSTSGKVLVTNVKSQ